MKLPYRVKANGAVPTNTNQPQQFKTQTLPKTLLVTRDQAAKELNVSTRTIDRLITKGTFKPCRIGSAIRIPFDQLERFAKGDYPNLDLS